MEVVSRLLPESFVTSLTKQRSLITFLAEEARNNREVVPVVSGLNQNSVGRVLAGLAVKGSKMFIGYPVDLPSDGNGFVVKEV